MNSQLFLVVVGTPKDVYECDVRWEIETKNSLPPFLSGLS